MVEPRRTTRLFSVPSPTPEGDAAAIDPAETDPLWRAVARLGIAPKDAFVVSGGELRLPTGVYGFEAPPGWAAHVAAGAKLANGDLRVVGLESAAQTLGRSLGSLLALMARDLDMTLVVDCGADGPWPDLAVLALAAGAGFVARACRAEPEHAQATLERALQHRGFSLVAFVAPSGARRLEEEGHDPGDRAAALERSLEEPRRAALGVLYERAPAGDATAVLQAPAPLTRSQTRALEDLG